jgi:uncharacterized ferritin-like protein (DUF455 family)
MSDEESPTSDAAPPEGTLERWAWDYVRSTDLAVKLSPPPPPSLWESSPPPRRLSRAGRPRELVVSPHSAKTPGPEALRAPLRRAQLVHTFLHHELQAAELMAWALLAFPDTPRAFRRGLVRVALDEVRHMGMYQRYLAALGQRFGDFPVRDWFWERVPRSLTAAHFVAVLGIGFEGANLDHAARFADRFRAVGDEEGAAMQETICAEEVPHVRFALRWFRRFTHADDFSTWARHLPPPLSPVLMRGAPLNRERRRISGFTEPFLEELAAWVERAPGS